MKAFVIILMIIFTTTSWAKKKNQECSLKHSQMPKCYNKRDLPIYKIALVYYGDHMTIEDLDRIEPILIERFNKATKGILELKIISKRIMDFKYKMPEDYTYNNITDPKRLQRIWYSENVGVGIMNEIYNEYKSIESEAILDELDAIAAITGAQFEGLGYASGRMMVTEYPREIAWGLPDGGRVELVSDYQLVDELLHELGHTMFLDHTSNQCQKPGMTYYERKACCDESPSKNDVLSYCRQRSNVDENFMHGFEKCSLGIIEDQVLKVLYKGGQWNIPNRPRCL